MRAHFDLPFLSNNRPEDDCFLDQPFRGFVRCKNLFIGEGARVHADAYADKVILKGSFKGRLKARVVEIHGSFEGRLSSDFLSLYGTAYGVFRSKKILFIKDCKVEGFGFFEDARSTGRYMSTLYQRTNDGSFDDIGILNEAIDACLNSSRGLPNIPVVPPAFADALAFQLAEDPAMPNLTPEIEVAAQLRVANQSGFQTKTPQRRVAPFLVSVD